MEYDNNFLDQPHIDTIRERLWIGREIGRAAVMVGAGFSRNATPVAPTSPAMPTWGTMVGHLYEQLYPRGSTSPQDYEQRKAQASVGDQALQLASEYQATFGRHQLDAVIAELVPDQDYVHGRVHELLLDLPWSDVFTTNYDTLLERTRTSVHERKYDLIQTPADIPSGMQPRIVKLHGSFPSHRPFIFTDEDFRTYTDQFAPFVNLVRESIMENAFCLLGFSGDDPNFRFWSGWVRDQLGPSAPPIYLCGMFNLSASRRRLLENRGIIPIDLSPLFPVVSWPDAGIRHARAIEWFLLNLRNGRPPDVRFWPNLPPTSVEQANANLPHIPGPPTVVLGPGKVSPPSVLDAPTLRQVCVEWRRNREEYPGWIVAPNENREILWQYTKQWVEPVLKAIQALEPSERVFLLFELNWRLETTLMPLFLHWVEQIAPVLEDVNPFPHILELEGATVLPTNADHVTFDWAWIQHCWIDLAFALAREAREDQDEDRFRRWMARLQMVCHHRLEWQVRWHYEECLFHLVRLDQNAVRETLRLWPSSEALPFWDVRRASILAELGDFEDAQKVASIALRLLRARLRAFRPDYELLSQEGWTMVFLHSLGLQSINEDGGYLAQYDGRWEQLGSYRANPWPILESLEATLRQSRPMPQPEHTRTRGFDPGTWSEQVRLFASSIDHRIFPAFAYLRLLEVIAQPAPSMQAATAAAFWIEPMAPLWSLTTLVRVGSERDLAQWADRFAVATLTDVEVIGLFSLLRTALTQSVKNLVAHIGQIDHWNPGFSQRHAVFACELLSRLSIRFTPEQLTETLNWAIELYTLPLSRWHDFLHKSLTILFKRLFSIMPELDLVGRLPELLALPIPSEAGFTVADPASWPEPFDHVNVSAGTSPVVSEQRSSFTISVARLLWLAEYGQPEARTRAVRRLYVLHTLGALSGEQQEAFAHALWARLDETTGLPAETNFLSSAFLSLPEPEPGRAMAAFRTYLLALEFPRVVHLVSEPGVIRRTFGLPTQSPFFREWRASTASLALPNTDHPLIEWAAEEVNQLLEKAAARWDEEKSALSDDDHPLFSSERQHWRQAAEMLADVVLPRLGEADTATLDLARRLITEMQAHQVLGLALDPMTLFVQPEAHDTVTDRLQNGLLAMDADTVKAALSGMFKWLTYSVAQRLPAPPPTLLDDIVTMVRMRRQPGLMPALDTLARVARAMPDFLNDHNCGILYEALQKLAGETTLPGKEERQTETSPYGIPLDDRPSHRQAAAALAYWLWVKVRNDGGDIPEALLVWQNICQSDSLPEVRRAWPHQGI